MCGDREDALAEAQVGILFLYDPRGGFRAARMKGDPPAFAAWLEGRAIRPGPHTRLGRLERVLAAVNIADVRSEDVCAKGSRSGSRRRSSAARTPAERRLTPGTFGT
jgi:hypothetical protein